MKINTPNMFIYPLKIKNDKDWNKWNAYVAGKHWDEFHTTQPHIGKYTREEFIYLKSQVYHYTYPFYIFKDRNGDFDSKKQHPRTKTWPIMCKELIHASPELKQELKLVLEKHLDIEIKL